MIKQLLIALVSFCAYAEASMFWQVLKAFYGDLTVVRFQQVIAWQIAGLFMPLVAGPMRVVANLIWTTDQGQATDYMRAYLYFFGIVDLDSFWQYFMDYLIYGNIYGLVGFNTDFAEINFAPVDILCYQLNSYDPVTAPTSYPKYCQSTEATALSITCGGAAGVTGYSPSVSAC